MNFFEKLRYEIELLGTAIKLVLKLVFYVLLFVILYKIVLPFLRYHLAMDLSSEELESVSVFIITMIGILTVIIGRCFINLFKRK